MRETVASIPSGDDQIQFLRNVQRLLEEGSFTASYKFALVHAVADLAVLRGDDSGRELPLRIWEIAERFVELYWRQVVPWQGHDRAVILRQNTGRQAAIVRKIQEARSDWDGRLDRLRGDPKEWEAVTREVSRVVRVMPLWRLQSIGSEVHDFLYKQGRVEGSGTEASIVLKPGVAYCLRTLHPLVLELTRSAWIRFVRRLNSGALAERTELGAFLFGSSRRPLADVRDPLLQLQEGKCLYCGDGVQSDAHVDHFIPWSRYPMDLGHNLVVAHNRCNMAKSDHLAAMPHLEQWVRRNRDFLYELDRIAGGAGLPHDGGAALKVTRWAYRQVSDRNGFVWDKKRGLILLDSAWEELLSQA